MDNLLHEIKTVHSLNRKVARTCTNSRVRYQVLTTLMGEMQNSTIGTDYDIDNDLCIATIKRFVKNINLTMDNIIVDGMRAIPKLLLERECLESFLPKKLTAVELESEIKLILATRDEVSIGIVMKSLNENYKDQFDGKMALEIITREI